MDRAELLSQRATRGPRLGQHLGPFLRFILLGKKGRPLLVAWQRSPLRTEASDGARQPRTHFPQTLLIKQKRETAACGLATASPTHNRAPRDGPGSRETSITPLISPDCDFGHTECDW